MTAFRTSDIAILATEYDAATAAALVSSLNSQLTSGEATIATEQVSDARTVVVLHGWMLGRSPKTIDEQALLEQRVAKDGADFLVIIPMDDVPLPKWAAKATVVPADAPHDKVVQAILAVSCKRGSQTNSATMGTGTDGEERSRRRDVFFATHRAAAACGREFKRLVEDVTRRASLLEAAEVHSAPGRCVVQYGDVALTLSWIRGRADSTAEGRLMIVEWQGTVRRGMDRAPERIPIHGTRAAVVRREHVLVPDATKEDDWRWRRESHALAMYVADDLAAACVDSLAANRTPAAVTA